MLIEMRNYLLRFLCFFNFECFLFVRIFSLYVQIVQIFQKKNVETGQIFMNRLY